PRPYSRDACGTTHEAEMIRSRAELELASEKDFCLNFLIPLLGAMGFKDVAYHHGGTLEQGKDIVMWKEGDFTPRSNFAVVAKSRKIAGNVGILQEILLQIKQSL